MPVWVLPKDWIELTRLLRLLLSIHFTAVIALLLALMVEYICDSVGFIFLLSSLNVTQLFFYDFMKNLSRTSIKCVRCRKMFMLIIQVRVC